MSAGSGPAIQQVGSGWRGRRRRPSLGRSIAVAVAGALLGGVVLGAVWRLVAPVAQARVIDGSVYLDGHQELQIAQDGWLAVLLALAGVLVATVQAVRAREPQAARAVLALLAVLAAGLVAWQVGQWLGPAPLKAQVAAGDLHPTTPIELRTHAVLLVGGLLFAITRFLAALLSSPHQR